MYTVISGLLAASAVCLFVVSQTENADNVHLKICSYDLSLLTV